MHVIQAVHVEVLHMPAEGREQHSRINPGRSYSADVFHFSRNNLEQGVFGMTNIVEIKGVGAFVGRIKLVCGSTPIDLGETTAVFPRGKISSIFDFYPVFIV